MVREKIIFSVINNCVAVRVCRLSEVTDTLYVETMNLLLNSLMHVYSMQTHLVTLLLVFAAKQFFLFLKILQKTKNIKFKIHKLNLPATG